MSVQAGRRAAWSDAAANVTARGSDTYDANILFLIILVLVSSSCVTLVVSAVCPPRRIKEVNTSFSFL